MSATIFNDIAAAQEAKDRFCCDHGLLDDFESHAACSLETAPCRCAELKPQVGSMGDTR